MKSPLFATKSLEDLTREASSEASGLKRVLGPWHLIFLGVGAIVGAGIFVITGDAAAQYAGPAVTLSFMLAGLTCAFVGLCYAEFASLIPIAGSAYTYAYSTLGEFFRLDHRVGLGTGIRRRCHHGGHRVVGLSWSLPSLLQGHAGPDRHPLLQRRPPTFQ